MTKVVMLEDGDDLLVMVRTQKSTVFDPAGIYGSVIRMYRAIGVKSVTSTLELVPMHSAQLTTTVDTDRVIEREGL